jgi:hypothetical protein
MEIDAALAGLTGVRPGLLTRHGLGEPVSAIAVARDAPLTPTATAAGASDRSGRGNASPGSRASRPADMPLSTSPLDAFINPIRAAIQPRAYGEGAVAREHTDLDVAIEGAPRSDSRRSRTPTGRRWLALLVLERADVQLVDVRRAAEAVDALPHDPPGARRALAEVCAVHDLTAGARLL